MQTRGIPSILVISQLKYDGFSTADATYGVDAVHANWNWQAEQDAKNYLQTESFSRSGVPSGRCPSRSPAVGVQRPGVSRLSGCRE